MFGRPDAAEAKKLLVVTAGRPEETNQSQPVFDRIGRQTFVAGAEPWQANAVKLCGNFRIIAEEKFEPAGFALKLGLKDIRLALATAREFASPMPVASIIRDHFLSAVALGQGDSDWSSLARISARNAGL